MTDVERKLWLSIRNRQLGGFKFRRQATIGPFVVNFLCVEARLIIELDGGQHDETIDAGRTAFLEARGHQVLRFWNINVIENFEGVLDSIARALQSRRDKTEEEERPSPNPLP